MDRRTALAGLAGIALGAKTGIVRAQRGFPARPVTLVVPYSPGGATDNVARAFSEHFQAALKQSVVVDNKAGANGRIGTQAVARATPDGYTLLLGGIGPLTIAPHVEAVPYDAINDFIPISLLVTNDVVLVTNPQVPADDLRGLISYLKSNPDKLNYGSSGAGGPFHLTGELFKSMAGVALTHVPYKGDGQALVDLMANNVQLMFTTISASRAYIESGRLKAIASAGLKRSSQLPQLPTIAESGLPDFSAETWQGLFAPRGTSADVIETLHAAVVRAMSSPALKKTLESQGNTIVASTPAACKLFIAEESKKWGDVVRRAGVKA